MASSGKKGRKNKGKVIPLQSFLSTDIPIGTAQVAKKVRNLDGDDSDDSGAVIPLIYQLPTAPRANRVFDDTSVPQSPPYIAYITNLPFDFTEDDLYQYFEAYNIVSVRLPRDENDTSNRGRGSASVVLETREDLIDVLSLPDPYIKGRRVRIDATNEQDQYGKSNRSGGNNRRGFDNYSSHNSENKESSGNWRENNKQQDYHYNRDRNTSRETSSPVSWRKGGRSNATNFPYNKERDSNSSYKSNHDILQERPKLNLKPRTLPLPEIVTTPLDIESKTELNSDNTSADTKIDNGNNKTVARSSGSSGANYGASSEKVFGNAKPVDTTARDREIEERLAENRRHEALRVSQENDISNKMKEINLDRKDYGEKSENSQSNWRVKRDISAEKYYDKGDNKRRDHHQRDSNRYNRERERNERSGNRTRNNKDNSVDGKSKYDTKRLDNNNKTNRTVTKQHISSQQESITQSSNMYSRLDDEASD